MSLAQADEQGGCAETSGLKRDLGEAEADADAARDARGARSRTRAPRRALLPGARGGAGLGRDAGRRRRAAAAELQRDLVAAGGADVARTPPARRTAPG